MKEKRVLVSATPIAADELRVNLSHYLSRVTYAGEVLAITKYGRNAAYLISPEIMQLLLDPAKRLTKKERQAAFQRMDKILAKVPATDPKNTDALIQEAVAAVRAERQQRRAKA